MTRTAATSRAPTQRSAVTNGSRMLVGIDGCSALARRYRDLVETLTAEHGADVPQAELLTIRNAATLQLHAEQLTARLVRGEAVDPEAITRATNGATRALAALKRHAKGKARRPSVADYLAGQAA